MRLFKIVSFNPTVTSMYYFCFNEVLRWPGKLILQDYSLFDNRIEMNRNNIEMMGAFPSYISPQPSRKSIKSEQF